MIEITNLTKQVDMLKHDLGKCQLQIQERDSRIVEKKNIIKSLETNSHELTSLRQTFDWINEEHSQCNEKLEKVTKQCEWLEDELQNLQPVTYQETSIESGSQKSELEDHDSQPTEKISTPKPDAGLSSSIWATQVYPVASSPSEQEQEAPTFAAATMEPMSNTSDPHKVPTINLPVAPCNAPKGPKGRRKPDHQPNYPTFGAARAGNHYKTEDFADNLPPSDTATTTGSYNKWKKQQAAEKRAAEEQAAELRGLQASRGEGHSLYGRGGYPPYGQRGGRWTDRGGYRGRGRGDWTPNQM